ncbi:DUF5345 family protein [Paenibacillus chartarius]|uniref:DUF5345 family protein n=1 Tax=Paenibacillus chartarius TaxID=747481 RepID=A0ABV6DSD5_9BACL
MSMTPDGNDKLAQEEEVIQRLREGLASLERIEPTFTPPLDWFETQVRDARRRRRSRLLRDLALLWSAGLLLLGVLYLLINRAPVAFVALQGAAGLAPLLLALLRRGGRGEEARHGME